MFEAGAGAGGPGGVGKFQQGVCVRLGWRGAGGGEGGTVKRARRQG